VISRGRQGVAMDDRLDLLTVSRTDTNVEKVTPTVRKKEY
jgi:hypothetical protein